MKGLSMITSDPESLFSNAPIMGMTGSLLGEPATKD